MHRAWRHRRATYANTMLLVDDDLTIDGAMTGWRLRSDLPDAQARTWVLVDCATKVIDLHRRNAPDLLLDHPRTPRPGVDLPRRVTQRPRALAAHTTTAMLLRQRRADPGLTLGDVAGRALLPEATIVGLERGLPPRTTQISRLAPVLHLSASVLLAAVDGRRSRIPGPGTSTPRQDQPVTHPAP